MKCYGGMVELSSYWPKGSSCYHTTCIRIVKSIFTKIQFTSLGIITASQHCRYSFTFIGICFSLRSACTWFWGSKNMFNTAPIGPEMFEHHAAQCKNSILRIILTLPYITMGIQLSKYMLQMLRKKSHLIFRNRNFCALDIYM